MQATGSCRRRTVLILASAALALVGCATVRRSETLDTEQVLAAAGFHMKLADTPEKLAHLQRLTPRRLLPHVRDGKVYYVYADPDVCKCVYAGTEQDYQEYRKLGLQKRLADDQLMAAESNLAAATSLNWGMWGSWPWW